MAFLLAQAGTTLYKVDVTSGVATALSLPSGVTLKSTRKPRFAMLDQMVVMTNSPSRNLAIDAEGTVRVLVPEPPTHGPDPDETGTGLTGTFKFWCSFFVNDADGNLLMESPLSDYYQEITIADKNISIGNIPLSRDSITGRNIYRSLTGGSVPYHLLSIEDNTTTEILNNTADSLLELLPSASSALVSPPGTVPGVRFKSIVEWKSRLWAVPDIASEIDSIYVTDTNKVYAWPNKIVAHPQGVDQKGVVGFGVRRNQLGFLKRVGVWMVSSTSGATGINVNNLVVSQISPERTGCVAEDSIVTINDKVYWLGRDGVWEWDDSGVHSITDELVAPWFKKDAYFTRSRFPNAFARYNAVTNTYELHLAALGSVVEDRWVGFNLTNRKWYGPHQTALFTPTHGGHLVDANGLPLTMVGGSDGKLYTGNSANKRDGASTVIDMDCYGPFHHGDEPDAHHQWGELSVLSNIESAGTATVTPYVGGLDAAAGTAFSHTLTTGRERLGRLGPGRLARLRFRKNTVNQGLTILGYELPWFTLGRR